MDVINVYVPDQRTPIRVPATLSHEEIRTVVVQQGHTACENADITTRANGDVVFNRVTGGAKAA